VEGTQTMESLSTELLDYIIQVASGEIKTKSMENRQYDFLPWKRDISL
jgi:altronate hydrolase